jgi:hypothetical protein
MQSIAKLGGGFSSAVHGIQYHLRLNMNQIERHIQFNVAVRRDERPHRGCGLVEAYTSRGIDGPEAL